MRDYHNKTKHTLYLGIVTGEQFQEIYENMSRSKDKLPTASTILPLTEAEGGTLYGNNENQSPMVQAWIFYEMKPEDNTTIDKKTGRKIETKQKQQEVPDLVM